MDDVGYIVGLVLGSVIMGGLIGLIPYFMAKKRGRKNFGIISVLLCILANFIAGLLLSVPVCVIIIVVLLVQEGKKGGNSNNINNFSNNMNNNMNNMNNMNNISNNNYPGIQSKSYCSHCGSAVNQNAAYCTSCGHKLR